MKTAFIGLGLMGGAMAANLLSNGHTVKGYDIAKTALDTFEKNGGVVATSQADAVNDADIVFTMLPNSIHVENAIMAHGGIGDTMRKGTLLIDCSTILPSTTLKVGEYLATKGIRMLDAPVGRTGAEAITGKLLFMVGGDKADLEAATPYFNCMGDTIIHCGKLGTGISSKLVNNYVTTTLNVLTAEALTLAEHLGLDQDNILEVLRGTPAGRGHINTTYPNKVLKGDISPAFMIELANKDLGLALDLGSITKVPLFTGAGARQAYSLARSQGRAEQDWTAMFQAIQQLAKMS